MMLPHGPDREAFDHATNGELKPVKLTGTMAFMFETRYPQRVTAYAATSGILQSDYADCWNGLEKRFDPTGRENLHNIHTVMPGLDPGIHAPNAMPCLCPWMAGSSPAMTVEYVNGRN